MARHPVRNIVIFTLISISCIGVSSLAEKPSTGPSWEYLGPAVNYQKKPRFIEVDASPHSLTPAIAASTKSIYVAYTQFSSKGVPQVHVRRWNGKVWKKSIILNEDRDLRAFNPTIALLKNTPYVAWMEQDFVEDAVLVQGKEIHRGAPQVFVKYRSRGGWIRSGNAQNVDSTVRAGSPVLAKAGRHLYLAWVEGDENAPQHLYLRQMTKGEWGEASSPLNRDPMRDAHEPSMTHNGKVGYVAWSEPNHENVLQVYVRQLDAATQPLIGLSLNRNTGTHAVSPTVAIHHGTPYVAWVEFNSKGVTQVFVKHWEQGRWLKDGDTLNTDPSKHALSPVLISGEESLFLAWTEMTSNGTPRIHFRRLKGDTWKVPAPPLPADVSRIALDPALIFDHGSLLATWKESNDMGVFEIRAGRLKEKTP